MRILQICIKINGQVGQGGEEGLVWSGLCLKDSQDDLDSEYIGFDGSPDQLIINEAFMPLCI